VLGRICERAQFDVIMSRDHWADQLHEPGDVSDTMEDKPGAYLLPQSKDTAKREPNLRDQIGPLFMDPATFRLEFGKNCKYGLYLLERLISYLAEIPEAMKDPWVLRRANDMTVPRTKEAHSRARIIRKLPTSILYVRSQTLLDQSQ
jgi:hypothetical protein